MRTKKKEWILSGSQLSPFHLKIAALLRFKKVPFRDFPNAGGVFENLQVSTRVNLLKAGFLKLTYPEFTELDEFPLVPFLFGPNGEHLYDSSSVAVWLDSHTNFQKDKTVKASSDVKINFLIQLIDEFMDEFGLYLAHHARWKVSASNNDAGQRLADEMPIKINVIRNIIAKYFSARQTKRCPYLFSVAPNRYHVPGLPLNRHPPSRVGFPPTHKLLEESYNNVLKALEPILRSRPYLFGERFTLADASVYGQLGMNLTDPSAAKWIQSEAPSVFNWLKTIDSGDFSTHISNGNLEMDELLTPLISEVSRIYYPLMKHNEKAFLEYTDKGETLFNEKAYWKGKSLYVGEIDGHRFKSVVKTFQVKTWRQIKTQWNNLNSTHQNSLIQLFPNIAPDKANH